MRSNSKENKTKIQKHILSFFDPADYGVRTKKRALELDAKAVNSDIFGNYKAGKRLAETGHFLIYDADMNKFIKSLGINKKNKKYSNGETFELYTHLIGREVNSLLKEKTKKKKVK